MFEQRPQGSKAHSLLGMATLQTEAMIVGATPHPWSESIWGDVRTKGKLQSQKAEGCGVLNKWGVQAGWSEDFWSCSLFPSDGHGVLRHRTAKSWFFNV